MAHYDAVVIGAGVNGLAAAAVLARAGRSVLVAEQGSAPGGLMAPREFYPGFKGPIGGGWLSSLPEAFLFDLDLGRYGLTLIPCRTLAVVTGRGAPVVLERDSYHAARMLNRAGRGDGDALMAFRAELSRLRRLTAPMLQAAPPAHLGHRAVAKGGQKAVWGAAISRHGWEPMLSTLRFFARPMGDVLASRFRGEAARLLMAALCLRGHTAGPFSPGSAGLLLDHPLAATPGDPGAPLAFGVQVAGGSASLPAALTACAREAGAKFAFDSEVLSVRVKDGKAAGVKLASGKRVTADAILCGTDVKHSVLTLFEMKSLPKGFVRDVVNLRANGSAAQLLFALDRAPVFADLAGDGPAPPGPVHFADSLETLERGHDAWKRKVLPPSPWLEVSVPTVLDPGLAPEGKHVLSVTVHQVPYEFQDGPWTDERRAGLAGQVLERLERHCPGLQESVLGQLILTPDVMESALGLTGGAWYGVDMVASQAWFNRPLPELATYRLPVKGAYLCGAGMHPGGAMPGAAGLLAAREALADLSAAAGG
ncbi:MAG: phytoene desaturase family protein [Alphaproteobacteria bacterium]